MTEGRSGRSGPRDPGTQGGREAKKFSTAALLAGLVSVGTLALLLLGYGMALAMESSFALPHSVVLETSFDLMELSSIAFAQIVTQFVEVASNGVVIVRLYRDFWPTLALTLGAWCAVMGAHWLNKKLPAMSRWRPSTGWLRFALVPLLILSSPLLALFSAMLLTFAMIMFAALPIIGMSAGSIHIKKYVIEPKSCVPPATRTQRLERYAHPLPADKKEIGADCVIVHKDDKELGRGRVVVSTSKAVILYQPDTGKAFRVPTSDAIVEAVGAL